MNYRRGLDLQSWVAAHTGLDVVVRLALVYSEDTGEDRPPNRIIDFDRLYEQTGRLIGIVDGLMYLDEPTRPTSVPVPLIMERLREHHETYAAPSYGIMQFGDEGAAPTPISPTCIAEIAVQPGDIGRQRGDSTRREADEDAARMRQLVASQPCCLCGRTVQSDDGGYDIVAPGAGLGEEGDPWYVPCGSAWRVVCIRHTHTVNPDQSRPQIPG